MEKWTVRRATMKITDRGERDEIIGVEVTRERDQVREETRNKNSGSRRGRSKRGKVPVRWNPWNSQNFDDRSLSSESFHFSRMVA